ncbi:glycosyltransferase family 4 protein [Candidatus Nitrospira bockiana]
MKARIAFLEGSPSLRAEKVLPLLTKEFRITYITSGSKIPPGDYERVIRFPKAKLFFQHSLAYSRLADDLYRRGEIDFVYTYHGIGCFIRKAPQLAFFGGCFAEEYELGKRLMRWYQRPRLVIGFLHYVLPEIITCRRAARVLTNSHALRRKFVEMHHLPDAKTGVVLNGVDDFVLQIFHRKFSEARGLGNDLLFVGRLHWSKGILDLIKAFNLRKSIHSKFYIIGTGPQARKAADIRDSRIILLGHRSHKEIFELMRSTKYFMFPSLREGFPNALAEAMASGHGCVYYDIPTSSEVAGSTGVSVQCNEPNRLLDALEELIASPEETRAKAEAAHQRARTFSWEECSRGMRREFLSFYESLT